MIDTMNTVALVSDLMTENITTVAPNVSLSSLGEMFRKIQFRHLPVLDDGELVGIVSRTDYDKIMLGFRLAKKDEGTIEDLSHQIPVSKVMTRDVATVTPYTTAEEVMKIFRQEKFHALPVLSEGGELVGIISHHDVFYYI